MPRSFHSLLVGIATGLLLVVTPSCCNAKSISFVATSQENLEVRAIPDELTVFDIDSVVKRTKLYTSHYEPSIMTHEEIQELDRGQDGILTTEWKPDVFLIRGSPVPGDGSVKSSPFGFVGAVTTAYGYHKNLIIRPDDVWITILSQFSFYVNARSEELRDKFVKFDGQKELKVTVYGYNVFNAPYDDMTLQFLDKISENIVDPTLREWFLPGFTTSTFTDDVVAAATAMCTFQDYFTYVYHIACGIPQVTMEGTVEDWELLQEKVKRLREFEVEGDTTTATPGILTEWVDYLDIIMENLVESARNGSKNNLSFWDNVLYYNSNGYGTPVLSGWITVFSFFDKDGQKIALPPGSGIFFLPEGETEEPRSDFPIIDMEEMNANIISCPATVDDNGIKYNATLFVGQMSFEYQSGKDEDTGTSLTRSGTNHEVSDVGVIKPRNDWALVIEEGLVELERPTEDAVHLPTFLEGGLGDVCFWYEHLSYKPSSFVGRESEDGVGVDDDILPNESLASTTIWSSSLVLVGLASVLVVV